MKTASIALLTALWTMPAFAACPAGQSEMLTVRLYFGQSMNGKVIPAPAWRDFVARSVTPEFPDGLTIFDAQGQWRDPHTRAIQREASKVIEIAAPETRDLQARIAKIRKAYAARFHQQSVGLLMIPGCGTF
jgi:transposase